MLLKDESHRGQPTPATRVLQLLMTQQENCPPKGKLRSTAFGRMGLVTVLEHHFCMDRSDYGESAIVQSQLESTFCIYIFASTKVAAPKAEIQEAEIKHPHIIFSLQENLSPACMIGH